MKSARGIHTSMLDFERNLRNEHYNLQSALDKENAERRNVILIAKIISASYLYQIYRFLYSNLTGYNLAN